MQLWHLANLPKCKHLDRSSPTQKCVLQADPPLLNIVCPSRFASLKLSYGREASTFAIWEGPRRSTSARGRCHSVQAYNWPRAKLSDAHDTEVTGMREKMSSEGVLKDG